MPKAYWIAHNDVEDEAGYKRYVAAANPVFERFGGRFIARGGRYETMDGTRRGRHVVIEFPDYAAAITCHNSPEYQAAAAIRHATSKGDLVIVEGLD
jgi:uncharacterized protein (DUF1330 family)